MCEVMILFTNVSIYFTKGDNTYAVIMLSFTAVFILLNVFQVSSFKKLSLELIYLQ